MSLSDILGLDLPTSEGSTAKVSQYNTALGGVVEAVIAGYLQLPATSSTNIVLSSDQGRNAFLELTGTLTANVTVFLRVPAAASNAGYSSRRLLIFNNTSGAFTITIKTTASGSTGKTIQQGAVVEVVHNNTNVLAVQTIVPPWIAPTLLNSWANFSGATNSAGYRMRNGRVDLKGTVSGGTGLNTIIFVLPTGYRPAKDTFRSVVSNHAWGELVVYSTGNVVAYLGSTTWFCLDGISFDPA
jgi:hypothetical protein